MSKAFYPRLAARNIVKNGKFYYPYLLTIIGCSGAIYILAALAQSGVNDRVRYQYLNVFMSLGIVILSLFCLIFLFYTNSFLMKRRSKELALYNVLGMGKRNIGIMLVFESLYTWVVGVVGGLLVGILLQRLCMLLIGKIIHVETYYEFSISMPGILLTCLLFFCILLLTFLNNLRKLRVQNPAELLRAGNAGEREPKTRVLLAILGLLTLGGGYYIAVTTENAVMAIGVYFIAVALVIIGTYCLFSAVSVAVLKALRKNKGFYYKSENFIGLSGLLHRMNRNAVGLANICILCTMVMVMVSSTAALFIGMDGAVELRCPSTYVITAQCDPAEPHDSELAAEKFSAAAAKQGLRVTDMTYYTYSDALAMHNGSEYVFCHTGILNQSTSNTQTVFLTTETFYKYTGQKLELSPGEIAAFGPDMLSDEITLSFMDPDGSITESRSYKRVPFDAELLIGSFVVNTCPVEYLVVADDAEFFELAAHIDDYNYCPVTVDYQLNGEAPDELIEPIALALSNSDTVGIANHESIHWESYWVETQQRVTDDFYALNGGFFFLGMFLGIIFLMGTVLIMYYKQISEGYEDHDRFAIMQQVGLPKEQIRKSINSQVLMVFFSPLIIAGIHILFDFNLVRLMLRLFGIIDTPLILLCTAATFGVFALVYTLVYLFTAKVYYKIIST